MALLFKFFHLRLLGKLNILSQTAGKKQDWRNIKKSTRYRKKSFQAFQVHTQAKLFCVSSGSFPGVHRLKGVDPLKLYA
jgi:hypothetical protein